ncbi:hypothetical protein [Neisseria canis]|uniref:Uncharacterized protein n=1 Tax=Neisseria canis TaxID=493 RepID=A0A1X3CR99_9NEIS|nr:hypothetical protein [Neisseria canis]OSI10145.1 hypothetical protein BWD07_10980 [Neisseria canis]VEF01109.1 Uncharacterised protein [Neisseria canis]
MSKRQLALALSGVFLAASVSHAAPNSITDKGSVSERKSVSENKGALKQEKIEVRNLQGGKLIQSGNKVILQGGTIVGKAGDKEPLIQIENPLNKQVIIRDTRIITDGITQSAKGDSAGIVVIENGNKKGNSKVKMQNVRVTSRNSNIQATAIASNGGKACAGVVCTGFDDDDESNIIVDVKGRNTFKAIAK